MGPGDETEVGCGEGGLKLFGLAYSDEQFVPLVMLFCRAVSSKSFFQNFEIGHFVYFKHAPVGELSGTALASGLVAEEARASILQAVVVRLDDAEFVLIDEADLVARGDDLNQ